MFGLGGNEIAIILLFGFLVFGPDKLPAMAKTAGQFIGKFRSAQNEMSQMLKEEMADVEASDPLQKPVEAVKKLDKEAQDSGPKESFTERKARYDKERAQQKAEAARKMSEETAVPDLDVAAGTSAPASEGAFRPSKHNDALIDQLYGLTPKTKKPVPVQLATPVVKRPTPEAVQRAIAAKRAEATKKQIDHEGEGD